MAEEQDREQDDALEGASSPAPGDELALREQAEIDRENAELAEAEAAVVSPMSGFLGPERWIQFTFVAIAALTFYLADGLIAYVWGFFSEPDATIVSGAAAVVGLLTGFLLYQNEKSNDLAADVVYELAKVTWPTREETYYSTIVVIATSVVAALYTGGFDAIWSAITDYLYTL
jgi:preprotein translocase SecE subunit